MLTVSLSFCEVLRSAYELLKTVVELEMIGRVDTRWSVEGLTGARKQILKGIVLLTRGRRVQTS